MYGIIFHWQAYDQNIWSGRPVDMQQWRETIKVFGGMLLVVVDLAKDGSCRRSPDSEVGFFKFDSFQEALDFYNPTHKLVFVEEPSIWNAAGVSFTNLVDYVHPSGDTLYVFGDDSSLGLDAEWLRDNNYLEGNDCISMEEPTASLWALISAGIVLRTRKLSGV